MSSHPTHYYFFDEDTKIIWYSTVMLTQGNFIGESDNPNPKAGGAVLMQQRPGKKVFGCKIKKYVKD